MMFVGFKITLDWILNNKYFLAVKKKKKVLDVVTELGVKEPDPIVSVSSSPCDLLAYT